MQNKLNNYIHINRVKETNKYNNIVNNNNKFLVKNLYETPKFSKIILNFSLKGVEFNKKKALSFFLALEMLTGQKCIVTLSTKNILQWKIRRGNLVGCKVTLRKNALYNFLDTIYLALPRMEKFKGIHLKKKKDLPQFSINLSEIILFHPIELGLGITTDVKEMTLHFFMNTYKWEENQSLFSIMKIPTPIINDSNLKFTRN